MLDTIKVKFPISPTPDQLEFWTRRSTASPAGERVHYVYNPTVTDDDVMVKYTYFPQSYNGDPLLTLEMSLPKLILGNNYQMIGSIDGSVKIANLILELVENVPQVDIGEGVLTRLDVCYNHQVGDLVDAYIRAIAKLDYPHRSTKEHKGEGVEFRSKHKTTKFYNKERESRESAAQGILRQETTILRARNLKELTGKNAPTLFDLDSEFIRFLLRGELDKLNLLDRSIPTPDQAHQILSEQYGSKAGTYYYGLLHAKQDKSKPQIANDLDRHPRSLDRQLAKIVEADIPLTLSDLTQELPPLVIP